MALKNFAQLSIEIDEAVHTDGPQGKTTAADLNALLKRLVVRYGPHLGFSSRMGICRSGALTSTGAGKTAILRLTYFGPAETDVVSDYAVQP